MRKKWKDFRKHKSLHRNASKRSMNFVIYLLVILIILVVVYLSYVAVIPQLASLFAGNGGQSQTTINATKTTLVNVNYIKSH